MLSFKQIISCWLLLLPGLSVFCQQTRQSYVVLVSLDGFRWDFPTMYKTVFLDAIAKEGVRATYLKSSFPTKTFPNHYSIITGLYPDHHGIVANKFYDTRLKKLFSLATSEKQDTAFYGGQPFWNVAEAQGVKTASYYWAGSDVPVNGHHPSIWKLYQKNTSLEQRIDSVLQWLQLPEAERPHFISVYLEEPDMTEHEFGPVSQQTRKSVGRVDSLVGKLWHGIQQLPIATQINLIVVSDHGLAAVDTSRAIDLEQYIPSRWLDLPTMGSPVVFLKARPGYYDSIDAVVKHIPHVQGYRSGKIPKRLHFGKNARALDFTLIADNGWSIITQPREIIKAGNHGFDNAEPDMRAIFYATGPTFKKDYVAPPFENVNIYALLGYLLQVKVPPNDGRLKQVKNMLRK